MKLAEQHSKAKINKHCFDDTNQLVCYVLVPVAFEVFAWLLQCFVVDFYSSILVSKRLNCKYSKFSSFRLTLFNGYRQNEVEILPSWLIYRKEEISLVETVVNKKGFMR